jgi:NADH dehydrogenase
MMNQRVIIIGGSGFVGNNLSKRLAIQGYASWITTRKIDDVEHIDDSKPLAKSYYVKEYSTSTLNELMKTFTPEDVVINLVGVLHSSQGVPYGPEFAKAHVELSQMIMQAMKHNGLRRYIHMSALGAEINGPSMYLRSKGVAESFVKDSGLDWTIFRPSVIFGKNDNFINMFGKLQKYFPVMPLAGADNLFQPVAVTDVSEAFMKAITMPQTIHQSYDLAGPQVLTLAQIIQFAAKKAGLKRPIIPLPAWMGYVQALLLENLPGPTIMSRDNLNSMKVPSILSAGQPNALSEVFGITPTPLESLLN